MAEPDIVTQSPQKVRKPRKKREKPIDKQLITSMLADGYQKERIAEAADVSRQTVWQIQKKTENEIISVNEYLRDRAKVLAYYQRQHLNLIEKLIISVNKDLEDGVMKPSEKGKIIFYLEQGFGIFYDKERLELGKSTSNTAVLQRFMLEAHENV